MTTLEATFRLPKELEPAAEALWAGAGAEVFGTWPEDESYVEAEEPASIATHLIGELHSDLVNARIAYLWREKMKRSAQVRLGKASKAGGKLRALTQLDFVIEFNWTAWRTILSPAQRVALVDHELCHCGYDLDKGYVIVHHDVEEFGAIVRRWGLWTENLRLFAGAVRQLDLFRSSEAT